VRKSSDCGIVNSSAFAVLRLISNSILADPLVWLLSISYPHRPLHDKTLSWNLAHRHERAGKRPRTVLQQERWAMFQRQIGEALSLIEQHRVVRQEDPFHPVLHDFSKHWPNPEASAANLLHF
jgi:hypothetical protein